MIFVEDRADLCLHLFSFLDRVHDHKVPLTNGQQEHLKMKRNEWLFRKYWLLFFLTQVTLKTALDHSWHIYVELHFPTQWSRWRDSSDTTSPSGQRQDSYWTQNNNPVTSLYPDVLPELGGHANQKSVTLGRQNFMEVVATAANNLWAHRQSWVINGRWCRILSPEGATLSFIITPLSNTP